MIKHIIAGISIILAIWASIYMYGLDKEAHKMQNIARIIRKSDITLKRVAKKVVIKEMIQTGTNSVDSNDAANKELKALKASSGNVAVFKVSPLYTRNCSSCHGKIGQGVIGPKLMGRTKKFILTNLVDFKSGVRKNYVMYGLLQNLTKDQLSKLATEIATFQSKYDAANKK
jgi:cytochrome c553